MAVLTFTSLLPFLLVMNAFLAKLIYSNSIGKDPLTGGIEVRNRMLPEELGRIDIILTDKTGTLT